MQITSVEIPSPITSPTSKSYANRALMYASLSQQTVELTNLPQASDVSDFMRNLREIGIEIETSQNKTYIKNSFPACETKGPKLLSGSAGGTTIRFLLTFLCLGKEEYVLSLREGMSQRPLEQQIDLLKGMGAVITRQADAIRVQGPIKLPPLVEVSCQETTQFASALKILKVFIPFELKLRDVIFSTGYLDMTDRLITDIGASYSIPPDFSSMSYLIAYAFLKQDLVISGVDKIDDLQGDSELLKIMEKLGGRWSLQDDQLHIYQSDLEGGFSQDISSCLDLFPTLCFVASFLKEPCRLYHLEPLKYKESDRLSEMLKLFDHFGQNYQLEGDVLTIIPSSLRSKDISTPLPCDHRIVMVAALYLKVLGGGSLNNERAVEKSFAEFFDLINGHEQIKG